MGLHRHGYRSYSQMSRMSMSSSEIAFSEICPVLVESNGKLQILKQETGNFFIFVKNLMQVLNLLLAASPIRKECNQWMVAD